MVSKLVSVQLYDIFAGKLPIFLANVESFPFSCSIAHYDGDLRNRQKNIELFCLPKNGKKCETAQDHITACALTIDLLTNMCMRMDREASCSSFLLVHCIFGQKISMFFVTPWHIHVVCIRLFHVYMWQCNAEIVLVVVVFFSLSCVPLYPKYLYHEFMKKKFKT